MGFTSQRSCERTPQNPTVRTILASPPSFSPSCPLRVCRAFLLLKYPTAMGVIKVPAKADMFPDACKKFESAVPRKKALSSDTTLTERFSTEELSARDLYTPSRL
jgi:hypothetical protein